LYWPLVGTAAGGHLLAPSPQTRYGASSRSEHIECSSSCNTACDIASGSDREQPETREPQERETWRPERQRERERETEREREGERGMLAWSFFIGDVSQSEKPLRAKHAPQA